MLLDLKKLKCSACDAIFVYAPVTPRHSGLPLHCPECGTRLRCSELFAIKWADFNWDRLTILVQRAIVDGVVGDVKTKYSQSGLPLDPVLAEILFTWKRASEFGGETDWVFASPQKGWRLSFTLHLCLGEARKAGRNHRRARQRGMAYLPAHLQFDAPGAWRRPEGAAGIAEAR